MRTEKKEKTGKYMMKKKKKKNEKKAILNAVGCPEAPSLSFSAGADGTAILDGVGWLGRGEGRTRQLR